MSDDTRTYVADSELAALLKAAAETGKRLRVQTTDNTYEVEVTPATESNDIWAGYDSEAAREALYASAGVLAGTGIDVEEWLEEIRESRKQDTPGRPAE